LEVPRPLILCERNVIAAAVQQGVDVIERRPEFGRIVKSKQLPERFTSGQQARVHRCVSHR
jgi:hypothetical protein